VNVCPRANDASAFRRRPYSQETNDGSAPYIPRVRILLGFRTGHARGRDKSARCQATECWNVGDICARTGQPRRFMAWRLSSGLDDTSPLASHIEQLLLVLCTRADEIRGLWTDYDLTLQCVGYFPETGHGAHFNERSSDSSLISGWH